MRLNQIRSLCGLLHNGSASGWNEWMIGVSEWVFLRMSNLFLLLHSWMSLGRTSHHMHDWHTRPIPNQFQKNFYWIMLLVQHKLQHHPCHCRLQCHYLSVLECKVWPYQCSRTSDSPAFRNIETFSILLTSVVERYFLAGTRAHPGAAVHRSSLHHGGGCWCVGPGCSHYHVRPGDNTQQLKRNTLNSPACRSMASHAHIIHNENKGGKLASTLSIVCLLWNCILSHVFDY